MEADKDLLSTAGKQQYRIMSSRGLVPRSLATTCFTLHFVWQLLGSRLFGKDALSLLLPRLPHLLLESLRLHSPSFETGLTTHSLI